MQPATLLRSGKIVNGRVNGADIPLAEFLQYIKAHEHFDLIWDMMFLYENLSRSSIIKFSSCDDITDSERETLALTEQLLKKYNIQHFLDKNVFDVTYGYVHQERPADFLQWT